MTDKKIRNFSFAALGLGLALTAHAAHVHASFKAIYKLETDQQEFKIGRHAFTYCYQKPVLAGNTKAIKKINAAWEKDYQHNQHNFALLKEAAVALKDLDTTCSSRFLVTVTYNKHGVISFRQDAEFYPVAAGYHKYNGGAYSLTTGNRIPVYDLVKGSREVVLARLKQEAEKQDALNLYDEAASNLDKLNYTIAPDGMVYIYPQFFKATGRDAIVVSGIFEKE